MPKAMFTMIWFQRVRKLLVLKANMKNPIVKLVTNKVMLPDAMFRFQRVRRLLALKTNMKCWRPKSHCSLGYEEGQVSECHVHYEQVSTRSETLGPENKHEMLETKIPL